MHVHFSFEPGSSMDYAKEKIVIKETNKYLGCGGYICDIINPEGKKVKGVTLSITKNKENKERLSIDGILISKEETLLYSFKLNNNDF